MKGDKPGRDQTGGIKINFISHLQLTTSNRQQLPNSIQTQTHHLLQNCWILNLNPKWVWEGVGFNIEIRSQFGTIFGICVGFDV